MGCTVSSLASWTSREPEGSASSARPTHIPLPASNFASFPLESPEELWHTAPSSPCNGIPEDGDPPTSLVGLVLNPVEFPSNGSFPGSGSTCTTPPDEAYPVIEVPIDLALDDEGLSTLEKIYLFSRSKATFHRVYIAHSLPTFLEAGSVSPLEAIEYVLPLLNGLAMDEDGADESVHEALAAELVSVIWWFYTHCKLVATEEQELDDPTSPTPISVQAFTPILGTLLLSPNAIVGSAARHAVVDILARMRRADVREGVVQAAETGGECQAVPEPEDVGYFGADERALFESEILQQVVIGMGRLDAGAGDEGDEDWEQQQYEEEGEYEAGLPQDGDAESEALEDYWDGGEAAAAGVVRSPEGLARTSPKVDMNESWSSEKVNPYFPVYPTGSPSGSSAGSPNSSPSFFGTQGSSAWSSPPLQSPSESYPRDTTSIASPSLLRSFLMSSAGTRTGSPGASFGSDILRPGMSPRAMSSDYFDMGSLSGVRSGPSNYQSSPKSGPSSLKESPQRRFLGHSLSETSTPTHLDAKERPQSHTLSRPPAPHQGHSDESISEHILHPPGEPEPLNYRPESMPKSSPKTLRRSLSTQSSVSDHSSSRPESMVTTPNEPLTLHAPIAINNPFTRQTESVGSEDSPPSSPVASTSSHGKPMPKASEFFVRDHHPDGAPLRPISPALRPPLRSGSPATECSLPLRSLSPVPRPSSPLRSSPGPSLALTAPIPRLPSRLSSTFILPSSKHDHSAELPAPEPPQAVEVPPIPSPVAPTIAAPVPKYAGGDSLALTASRGRDMSEPSYFPSVLHSSYSEPHSQTFLQSQPLISPSSERGTVPIHYTAVTPTHMELRTPVFIGGQAVTFNHSEDAQQSDPHPETQEEMYDDHEYDEEEYDYQAEVDAAEAEAGEQAAVGRLSSMSLMAAVTASGTLAEETKLAFVNEVVRVSADPIYWVRREASFALGALAKVVSEEVVMSSLLPLFESLSQDPVWHVRHSALFALGAILARLPPQRRRTLALETLIPLSEDENAPVRSGVLESLGEAISTFYGVPGGPPEELVHLFLGRPEDSTVRDGSFFEEKEDLVEDLEKNIVLASIFSTTTPALKKAATTNGTEEPEAPVSPLESFYMDPGRPLTCAFNYPAVTLTLGAGRWGDLREIYLQLAQNKAVNVRRTLAASLGEMAKIIGPENARTDLMDIWWRSIRSEDEETRMRAVESMEAFSNAIFEDTERNKVTGALLDAWGEGVFTGWREREALLNTLAGLAPVLEDRVMRGLLLKGLEDPVSAVREAAVFVMPSIWKALENRPDVLDSLRTDIARLATTGTHRQRMTFVASQQALVTPGKYGAAVVVPDDSFWQTINTLADDSVVGVRIGVARLVGVVCADLPEESHTTSPVLRDLARHLSLDAAPEVRAYIPLLDGSTPNLEYSTSSSASFFSRPPPLPKPLHDPLTEAITSQEAASPDSSIPGTERPPDRPHRNGVIVSG